MVPDRQAKHLFFVLQIDASTESTYFDLSFSLKKPFENRKENSIEGKVSMSFVRGAEEVNGSGYLLHKENDKFVAIFEKVQKEIEIVLNIDKITLEY